MGTTVVTEAHRLIMMETDPGGWKDGRTTEPSVPGVYERRHSIGTTRDWFDGQSWVRMNHRRVVCANQDLDWREVAH